MNVTKEQQIFFEQMGKYPFLFAAPIFFGNLQEGTVKNGTLTLIDVDTHYIGVTCWHAIKPYLNEKDEKNLIFQIGSFVCDPSELLIEKSELLDLATLKIPKEKIQQIKGRRHSEIGGQGKRYDDIYQNEIKKNDLMIFGGFLAEFKRYPKSQEVEFGTCSFTCMVETSVSEQFSCLAEEFDQWYSIFPNAEKITQDPGGLSGGPVFIEHQSQGGIISYKLAGIIYEGRFFEESNTLIIKMRPAKFIKEDGSIIDDY